MPNKMLVRLILSWLILWIWFLLNRLRKAKKNEYDFMRCTCGESYLFDGWYGLKRWRNLLHTITDVHEYTGEYWGYEWNDHVICWRCGRYHSYSDSSV